jgi:hypothetical protein
MSLNDYLRGIVERYIDDGIQSVPVLVQVYRQHASKELGITTMEDYIFGFIHGWILAQFVNTYRSLYSQLPPLDIQQQVGAIIFRRSREIRDAIYRQG